MNRLYNLCLSVTVLMSDVSPLLAQDVFIQNEPQILLPIGRRSWEGTYQELRQINRISVPASYRAKCVRDEFSNGSTRSTNIQPACHYDLVNWHFNFGTERSAERALEYIVERVAGVYGLSSNASERYIDLLPEGLSEAEAYLASENLTYETFLQKDRTIESSRFPALAELSRLKEELELICHIASFYARAADWYRSPSLLREATRWHGYLPETQVLEAGQSSSDPERLLSRIADFRQDQFQALSLAVARAAVLRSEESILAANATSASVFKDPFRDGESRSERDRRDAEQYRYLRFRIQLLADEEGLDVTRYQDVYLGDYDFHDIEALIRPHEREMEGIYYLGSAERGRFAEAIIAQGEHDVHLAPKRCVREPHEAGVGLDILFNGGLVVSSAHKPTAYRRIAQLYLALYEVVEKCEDEEGMTYIDGISQYRNQARFYQSFLDNYEKIALGR